MRDAMNATARYLAGRIEGITRELAELTGQRNEATKRRALERDLCTLALRLAIAAKGGAS